jgi:hypothetical protein
MPITRVRCALGSVSNMYMYSVWVLCVCLLCGKGMLGFCMITRVRCASGSVSNMIYVFCVGFMCLLCGMGLLGVGVCVFCVGRGSGAWEG